MSGPVYSAVNGRSRCFVQGDDEPGEGKYVRLGCLRPTSSVHAVTGRARAVIILGGDLVFFDGLRHNGIYVGAGRFIHASKGAGAVRTSSLNEPWYRSRWVGGRRL